MRRAGFSPIVLIIGLVFGIAGALYWAWQVDPVLVTDVSPDKLARDGKRNYGIAVSLAWARDGDTVKAASRLAEAGLNWQDIADFACELTSEGGAQSNSGVLAISSMVALARTQGIQSCPAVVQLVTTNTPIPTPTLITPTNTRVPVATKTATPTLGVTFTPPPLEFTPTPVPPGEFTVDVRGFCAGTEGRIEVLVQTSIGDGIPGIAISIRQDENRDIFFTGLMPERDPGYADFTMTPERAYVVALRDYRQAFTNPLTAGPCSPGSPDRAGYRITFRRLAGE
ncbi:MAG: hypothetical protein KF726_09495 [Anaerolineae bacterium]|nr:hypothetical protein [Anaerolineae bacterium]